MFNGQFAALVATVSTCILALGLAVLMTRGYMRKRDRSKLFWSLGLWVFAFTVFLELLFALNVYSGLLINSYLFLVAILVELLALGSIQLVKSKLIVKAYYVLAILGAALTAYSLLASNAGNLITGYVVGGLPPALVIYASSLATFPAAIVIIGVAAVGFKRTRKIKLLSIIAGVIVVSVAGTLYIGSFPSLLYYSEFIGILLLWAGFRS
ncbi:MAG TPA: hypothetical protein VND15_02715 [Candidatus Acidoferrales bacterium]|nr:hypothetical protein [Candidatus Acidoferrales bacterium]